MYQPTLEDRLAATIAGSWELSGDEMNDELRKWIDCHRSEWMDIVAESRRLAAMGKPFSFRDQIFIPLKYEKHFGCGHTLVAPMERQLCKMVPGFVDWCRMSKSKVDAS